MNSYAHSVGSIQAFYSVSASDWGVLSPPSGVQPVMPLLVGAGAAANGYIMTNSRFKPGWRTTYVKPTALADPSGVSVGSVQCIAPTWAAGVTVTNSMGASPADTSFCTINGCLFSASAGTTGATVPKFTFTAGDTIVDNSVTWTCRGNRGLLKITFENASGSGAEPTLEQYDFFQE
jgi:hypothetical protein